MATPARFSCFADAPPIAAEVARGVTRLFCRQDLFAVCEMPLPNGRRADLMAIDAKGGLTIVEIKVAKARPASATANGSTISIIATASSGPCRRIWRAFWKRSAICPAKPA